MWPVLLAIGAGLALTSGPAKKAAPPRRAPITGPPPPAPPASHASTAPMGRATSHAHRVLRRPMHAAKHLRVTQADATFAVELARIHEPNPAKLRQFAALLRANGFQKQAQELMAQTLSPGSYGPVTAREERGGFTMHPHAGHPHAEHRRGKRETRWPTRPAPPAGGLGGMSMGGSAAHAPGGAQRAMGTPQGAPGNASRTPQGSPNGDENAADAALGGSGSGENGDGSPNDVGNDSQGQEPGDSGSNDTGDSSSSDGGDSSGSGDSGDSGDSGGGDASVSGNVFSHTRASRYRQSVGAIQPSDQDDGPPGWVPVGNDMWGDPQPPYSAMFWLDAWDTYNHRLAAAQGAPNTMPVVDIPEPVAPTWPPTDDDDSDDATVNGAYAYSQLRSCSSRARVGDDGSDLSDLAAQASGGSSDSSGDGGGSGLSDLSGAVPSKLPQVGNVQAQIQQGMALLGKIQGGSVDSAIEGGIGEAVSLGSSALASLGTRGQQVANILEGAAAGAAAGSVLGPYGAAAGAVIGAVAGFVEDLFGGNPLPPIAVNASDATQAITAAIQGWNGPGGWGQTFDGRPQGWHMADWCAASTPPSKMNSFDAKRLRTLAKEITDWVMPFDTQGLLHDNRAYVFGGTGPATVLNYAHQDNNGNISAATFASWQAPICSAVFWNWWQPQNISSKDCANWTGGADNDSDAVTDLTYNPIPHTSISGPSLSANALKQVWVQMTKAQGGKTASQIVASAMTRRPSPLWFASDLYGAWLPTGGKLVGADWSTVYWDCDLLNGMATVLGMLSVGSPTSAICHEIMLQITILHDSGSIPDSSKSVSPGLVELLDDYLYMAHQESWLTQSKRATFTQWVAHYLALASKLERGLARQWFVMGRGNSKMASALANQTNSPLSTFRTMLQAANS